MPFSIRSTHQSMEPAEQMAAYLDRIYGKREGTVRAIFAPNGLFNEKGAYRHGGDWPERSYRWPDARERLMDFALSNAADCDVYVRVTLRSKEHPGQKGSGLGGRYCWVDLDRVTKVTLQRLELILSRGSHVVHSGQPRHRHVYIKLDGVYPAEVLERLNELLDGFLGGDSKYAENTVLRLPGTLNHKGTAQGQDPFPVTLEVIKQSEIPPWNPTDLEKLLEAAVPLKGSAPHARGKVKPRKSRSRNETAVITPVEPDPIPVDIPEELLKRLGEWNDPLTKKPDRSAMLHRFVLDLVRMGYSDGVIMGVALLHEPGQDKWGDDETLRREIQRSINKWRLSSTNAEVDTKVAEIRGHFQEHYRSPRTFKTDDKVIVAFCQRAKEIGSLKLDMAQRELCQLATVVSRVTITKSLTRLQDAGYLKRLKLNNGQPLRMGKGPISTRAYRYRLTLPVDKDVPHMHRGFGFVQCGTSLAFLDPKGDQWWYSGGLCSARRTYELLLAGVSTVTDLSNNQGMAKRSITRHLERLADNGLAEQRSDGSWVAFERPAEEIALQVGMSGKGKQEALKHQAEREGYRYYLSAKEDAFQELMDWGYVWGGPGNAFLIAPEAARKWREQHPNE